MSCSPLLDGVDDPVELLRIVHKHPVLLCSESFFTYVELKDRGWIGYEAGCWRITPEGETFLEDNPEEDVPPNFFEL